jgi:hypothetical protein
MLYRAFALLFSAGMVVENIAHSTQNPHARRTDSASLRERLLTSVLETPTQVGVKFPTPPRPTAAPATRRLARPADAPPLAIIRSVAYFSPVIDEVLSLPVSPQYFRHLRQRIATFPSDK